jgi:DUF1365 family protein
VSGQSAIYTGSVIHRRIRPRPHRLSYRVFSLLVDLDELPGLGLHLRLFAHNEWGLFSFFDRDHGDGSGHLRRWVENQLAEAGLAPERGAIRILCYPRILGYVFNPLTVYFCHQPSGELIAILYEVSNRHSERHTYVIPVGAPAPTIVRQTCLKAFYVSPFIPMNCVYRFRVAPPRESVSVLVAESDAQGPLLTAAFFGSRRLLSDAMLLRLFCMYPLMTLKVTLGIHWEALRLFAKRLPVFPHRRAQERFGVSVVEALTNRREDKSHRADE